MPVVTSLAPWMFVAAAGLAPAADPATINGGQTVEPCGWPSVVLLRGNGYLCSGNLIHPEIVATAAHCIAVMEPETEVEFGDTANTAHPKVDVEYCTASPDFIDTGDGTIPFDAVGNDWGFCKLAAPVTDVTPIPPLYGCELELIQPGAEIVRVGFGKETLATNQFFKRWVQTQINEIPFTGVNGWPTQLSEGGNGEGTCPGDSGGPSFIRVPAADGGEDAWRMVAIQSTQPLEDGDGNAIECGDAPNNTAVLAQGVAFIEAQSGVDVTPCFEPAGGWDPTFACQGFPIEPGAGGGTWAMGCSSGELSGFSAACGIAFDDANPDAAVPLVAIVEPAADTALPYDGAAVVVHVEAEADDGADGWGIAGVELVIVSAEDDTELGRFADDAPPWAWDPEFPQGAFRIRAVATDNAGLVGNSDEVRIDIGVESGDGGAETTAAGDSSGGGDGSGAGAETTAAAPAEDSGDDGGLDGTGGISGGLDRGDDGAGGCGCGSAPSRGGGWAALLLLAGLRRRRRGAARG